MIDQGDQFIGFGVLFIGKFIDGFIQNLFDVGSWCCVIDGGCLFVLKGLELL